MAAIRTAMGSDPSQSDPQRAIQFYHTALSLSWIHMAMVVGTAGARTIADHGARVASRKFPDLKLVRVTDNGLDLAPLLSSDAQADARVRLACMEELCLSVFEILRELTGDVIVAPMLDKLKEEQAHPA